MDAGLLDVLHDPADQDVLAVAHRVDVDLDRDVEEAVEQHRAVVRHLHRVASVGAQVLLVVDDLHGAPAEHVGGAHHERKAHLARERDGLVLGARGGVGGLLESELPHQRLEALAVLGDVDRIGRGADDGHAGGLQRPRQLERRLPAELHDDALGLLHRQDLEHVFERERLEVQAVGGVVVGGDGLGVAVDHDGLETVLAQRSAACTQQ